MRIGRISRIKMDLIRARDALTRNDPKIEGELPREAIFICFPRPFTSIERLAVHGTVQAEVQSAFIRSIRRIRIASRGAIIRNGADAVGSGADSAASRTAIGYLGLSSANR
jgi:hypothetical protein